MPHRKGKIYNNGIISKKFYDGEQIPDGFVLGRLPCKNLSEERKKEIVEKRRKAFLEKYGVDNPAKVEEFKNKAKQTNLERYGVTCTVHNEEIQKKVRKTNLERYGTEFTFQSDIVKDKIKQTNLDRYGAENPFASDIIKQKIIESNRQNLGVDYPMQSEEIREKSKITSLEVYGTEYPNQSDIVKEHIRESNVRKYGYSHPSMSEDVKERTRRTTFDRYGVDWYFLLPEARVGHSKDSKPNIDFAKRLDESGILYEREFHLSGYLYDFKVGNILIEINPTVTHNTEFNPFGDKVISSDYHYNKSKTAEEHGYRCIHVFDWDDINKIINLLKPRERVYARQCVIKYVDVKEVSGYLSKYHLQGTCRGQEVCLGLYYKDFMVSLMTFGKPRYNKNYEWELLRYVSSHYVIGGAEKLFKRFISGYKPESVISYCDKSKFTGGVYKSLGFIGNGCSSPSKHWYSPKEKRHITDNLLRQRGADQLIGTDFGKGTSNEEIMISRWYFPVYDCGQEVWIYKKG